MKAQRITTTSRGRAANAAFDLLCGRLGTFAVLTRSGRLANATVSLKPTFLPYTSLSSWDPNVAKVVLTSVAALKSSLMMATLKKMMTL